MKSSSCKTVLSLPYSFLAEKEPTLRRWPPIFGKTIGGPPLRSGRAKGTGSRKPAPPHPCHFVKIFIRKPPVHSSKVHGCFLKGQSDFSTPRIHNRITAPCQTLQAGNTSVNIDNVIPVDSQLPLSSVYCRRGKGKEINPLTRELRISHGEAIFHAHRTFHKSRQDLFQ